MKSFSNECGSRNSFGYYDYYLREIILKRPCYKKADIEEVVTWIDSTNKLRKFSLGLGGVESFVANGNNVLYKTARDIIKKSAEKSQKNDSKVLKIFLAKLMEQKELRNLSLRCVIFENDDELFTQFIDTIRALPNLVYLDLTGCYLNEEQLYDLADTIMKSHVCHLKWPEPVMERSVQSKITSVMGLNKNLVVLSGVPAEMQRIAVANCERFFALGAKPQALDNNDREMIIQYQDAIRIALANEHDKITEMEKVFASIFAEATDRLNQIVKISKIETN